MSNIPKEVVMKSIVHNSSWKVLFPVLETIPILGFASYRKHTSYREMHTFETRQKLWVEPMTRNPEVPVHVFYSHGDRVVSAQDILLSLERFKGATINPIAANNFNHFDFLWSSNSKELVFKKVLEVLQIKPIPGLTFLNENHKYTTNCIQYYTNECYTNPFIIYQKPRPDSNASRRTLLLDLIKYSKLLDCVSELSFTDEDSEEVFFFKVVQLLNILIKYAKDCIECNELLWNIKNNSWFIGYNGNKTGGTTERGGWLVEFEARVLRESLQELKLFIERYNTLFSQLFKVYFTNEDTEEVIFLKLQNLIKYLMTHPTVCGECHTLYSIITKNYWFIHYSINKEEPSVTQTPKVFTDPIVLWETQTPKVITDPFVTQNPRTTKEPGGEIKVITNPPVTWDPLYIKSLQELMLYLERYKTLLSHILNLKFTNNDTEDIIFIKLQKFINYIVTYKIDCEECYKLLAIIKSNSWFIHYTIIQKQIDENTEEPWITQTPKVVTDPFVTQNPRTTEQTGGEIKVIINPPVTWDPIYIKSLQELMLYLERYKTLLNDLFNLKFTNNDTEDIIFIKLQKFINYIVTHKIDCEECYKLLAIIKSNSWFIHYTIIQKRIDENTEEPWVTQGPLVTDEEVKVYTNYTNPPWDPLYIKSFQELMLYLERYNTLLDHFFNLKFTNKDSEDIIFIKLQKFINYIMTHRMDCEECFKLLEIIKHNSWFIHYSIIKNNKGPWVTQNPRTIEEPGGGIKVVTNPIGPWVTQNPKPIEEPGDGVKVVTVPIGPWATQNPRTIEEPGGGIKVVTNQIGPWVTQNSKPIEEPGDGVKVVTVPVGPWVTQDPRPTEGPGGELEAVMEQIRDYRDHLRTTMDIKILWDDYDLKTFGDNDKKIITLKDYDDPNCHKLIKALLKHIDFLNLHNISINMDMDLATFIIQLVKIELLVETLNCDAECQDVVRFLKENDWFREHVTDNYLIKVIFERVMGDDLTKEVLEKIKNSDYNSRDVMAGFNDMMKLLYQQRNYLKYKFNITVKEKETRLTFFKIIFLTTSLLDGTHGCDETCRMIVGNLKGNPWLEKEVSRILNKDIPETEIITEVTFFDRSIKSLVLALLKHASEIKTVFGIEIIEYDKDLDIFIKILNLLVKTETLGKDCFHNCQLIRDLIKRSVWYIEHSRQYLGTYEGTNILEDLLQRIRLYQEHIRPTSIIGPDLFGEGNQRSLKYDNDSLVYDNLQRHFELLKKLVVDNKKFIQDTFSIVVYETDDENEIYRKVAQIIYKGDQLGDECVKTCRLLTKLLKHDRWYLTYAEGKGQHRYKPNPFTLQNEDLIQQITKFLDHVTSTYGIQLKG